MKITKIIKHGMGQKVGSEFGYSSFEIQPTTIEAIFDPPLNLDVETDSRKYDESVAELRALVQIELEEDTSYYAALNNELRMTLEKKKEKLARVVAHDKLVAENS